MVMASTSELMRPLKRSTMPLVCGVRGLVWRYCAPSSAQAAEGLGEAAAVVCQYMCHAERQGSGSFMQKGDGAGFGLVVLDGEMDRARAGIDGGVEIAFAPFAISSLQLGQMLDVEMDEAEVVLLEGALAFGGLCRYRLFFWVFLRLPLRSAR